MDGVAKWDKEYRMLNPTDMTKEGGGGGTTLPCPDKFVTKESFPDYDWFMYYPIQKGRASHRDLKEDVFTIDEWLDMHIELSLDERINRSNSLF